MSNHFHFSVKVKSKEEINTFINNLDSSELTVVLKRYKESVSFREQRDHIVPVQRDRIASSEQRDRIASSEQRDRIAASDTITMMRSRLTKKL